MKSLKNSKLKAIVAIVLLIVLCCSTVFAETEGQIEPRTEGESSEDDISLISVDEEYDDDAILNAIMNQQTLTSDQYLFKDKVELNSAVSGNVFVIAREVTINTSIDGNIFIMADKVNFADGSYVYSDAFVMAEEVSISGYMYDLYCMANNVTINNGGCIIRDLHLGCNNFTFGGLIRRDAYISANKITTDDANAVINGKLIYEAPENTFPTSIVSSGNIEYSELNEKVDKLESVKNIIMQWVVSLIVVLIIIFAIPKFAEKEEKLLKNKLGQTIGFGTLALFAIPVICAVACITVIGILPGVSALLLYIFTIQIVASIVSVPVSSIICEKIKKESKGFKVLIAMLYVIACSLLDLVPIIGALVGIINVILAMGLLVCSIFIRKVENK